MFARKRIIAFAAAFLVACVLLVGLTHELALRAGLDRMERSGRIALVQASDRLIAQLESYRELVNLTARHPQVGALIEGRSTVARTSEFLLRTALISGAETIYVLDRAGRVVAASSLEEDDGVIGRDLSGRADVVAAATGRMGLYHAVSDDTSRGYYLTRGVLGPDARPQGFVVVQVNMDQLEYIWRIDENVVTFFDDYGVVFVSNRLGLALTRDAALARMPQTRAPYPDSALVAFPEHRFLRGGGRTLWAFSDRQIMPARALVVSQEVPLIEMTARSFLDISPATAAARLQASLVAALLGVLALGLMIFGQSRQRMADLLRIEEEANAVLEARVVKRNAQLQQAQDNLIQASKLTALGQMSAGISHELNQPLSAIQNYAENARKLIARDRVPEASDTLGQISEQIQRVGRIIQNLRSFARKETEPLEQVDVAEVVRAALALAAQRAKAEGVRLESHVPKGAVLVEAGHVRLQQVLVNLMSNAMDAMADAPRRKITVTLAQDGAQVRLVVQDTGPGLVDIDRAFEPFYTTKDIGASKGMGLGLSISYGIIGSFGGVLSVENPEGGGAAFTITLPLLAQSQVGTEAAE